MFSGIITHNLKPKKLTKTPTSLEITFDTPKDWKLSMGESITLNGVCTTVEKLTKSTFSVFCIHETLKKTNFSTLKMTDTVNAERCLTLQDLVGGHLVYGHVDATGKVTKIEADDESKNITFQVSENLTRYIVYKGSIAVNGVSLTVVTVTKDSFSVSLIPHTLEVTNLGSLKKGDTVNIEVDMMAKHLEKLVKKL